MIAFVLIKTRPRSSEQVLKETKSIPEVTESYMVTGIYDIITKVNVEDLKKLGEVVAEKLHSLDGVSSTITCIVVQ